MKHLLPISFMLFACITIQSISQKALRTGCDELYTENMERILTQFQGVTPPEQLKEYREFMLAIKLRNDVLFKLTPMEHNMLSETRALLRSPLTNYTACRSQVGVAFGYDFQTVNPAKRVLAPCETTYAAQIQNILDSLRPKVSADTLKHYEKFLLMLKYYEDLGFILSEFERKTRYAIRARLREPLVKYNTCRDTLIHMQNKAIAP